MKFYAGVDGGQSSTTALVGDDQGRILGRGAAGRADDVGRSLVDSAAAIDAAIAAAVRAANQPPDVCFERVVVGLSGLDESRSNRPPLATCADDVVWLHDSEIAHAGALAGEPGIVVIAGTGSVALGIDDTGRRASAGGWGHLFGDEGSAFWLGRRAVSLAMQAEDRGRDNGLCEPALRYFGVGSLREVQRGVADGSIGVARVAGFAPEICALGARGVPAASLLVTEAAEALASLVLVVERRLTSAGERRVSYHGGLWTDDLLRARWTAAVAKRLPGAHVIAPLADASEGALQIARDGFHRVTPQAPPERVVGAGVLEALRGGLIVSVQAEEGSLLGAPSAIATLSHVAVRNGAAGVRIEGTERIVAVRAAVAAPIVGIIKRKHPGFEPYITSTISEVDDVASAGADIVAFDATDRPHAGGTTLARLVDAVHAHGLIAMADCSTAAECSAAARAGADIVATTLAGYTQTTRGRGLPALDVVTELRNERTFVICEGGIAGPDDARAAFAAGAAAVVVGTALTNLDFNVRRFVAATPRGARG